MYTQQLDPQPYITASYLIGATMIFGYFFYLFYLEKKLAKLEKLMEDED